MENYAVALGHNVADISLTDIDPQPMSKGIRVTERTASLSGVITEQGEYVDLEFNVLESVTQYLSILELFDLHDGNLRRAVTVRVRDARLQPIRKNGYAILPEIGSDINWNQFFPRDITIRVRDLSDPT